MDLMEEDDQPQAETQPQPFTPAERIAELNEIDKVCTYTAQLPYKPRLTIKPVGRLSPKISRRRHPSPSQLSPIQHIHNYPSHPLRAARRICPTYIHLLRNSIFYRSAPSPPSLRA